MPEQETENVEETKKVEYESINCKYEFSLEELQEIAETLAVKIQDLRAVEDEKKSTMSSYKERIDMTSIEISKAARLYKNKNEMRMIECVVDRDFKEGVVTYTRIDTGEIARTTKMTMGERQMHVDDALKDSGEINGAVIVEAMSGDIDKLQNEFDREDALESDIQTGKTNRLMAGETAVEQ